MVTRIGIYSRQSVYKETGESTKNQIELCKAYCERNIEGEKEYLIFDDEGFTGSNVNRPAFKRMIIAIENKKIDTVVCYRLDRISRSVIDFNETFNKLQENNVKFISITEHFQTDTPLGIAMLQISSVFAELERRNIAERVRDNMLEMGKKGRFTGGITPLGFNSKRIKYLNEEMKEKSYSILTPNIDELQIVKYMYESYIKLGSITKLEKHLSENNIRNRAGTYYEASVLSEILRNPIYVKSNNKTSEYLSNTSMQVYGTPNGNGYLLYNRKDGNRTRDKKDWICAITNTKGYIEPELWLETQKILDKNRDKKVPRAGTGNKNDLLSGLIKCSICGRKLFAKEAGRNKYQYYICYGKKKLSELKCRCKNVRADVLDEMVINSIKVYSKEIVLDTLDKFIKNNNEDNNIEKIQENIKNEINKKNDYINSLIDKISLSTNDIVTKKLMEKIDDTSKEIEELKLKLENEKIIKEENKSNEENVKIFIENIKNFSKNIDSLDTIFQKRELLRILVKEVIWDGDNYTATIKYNIDIDEESKKK
jgi:DNA invertase Pin-like site-specific DNA recombinase